MNTKKLVLTALTVTLLSTGAAIAGSGNNGNGNSNGNGASNGGNNGRGAIASELKWRNAAHASAQAFLNANSNSAVGKLATLVNATDDAAAALVLAGLRDPAVIQAELDLLTAPTKTSKELQDEIDAALYANSSADVSGLLTDLGKALAYEALEKELKDSLALPEVQAQAEAEAVVGVDDLSDEALAALWDMLDK